MKTRYLKIIFIINVLISSLKLEKTMEINKIKTESKDNIANLSVISQKKKSEQILKENLVKITRNLKIEEDSKKKTQGIKEEKQGKIFSNLEKKISKVINLINSKKTQSKKKSEKELSLIEKKDKKGRNLNLDLILEKFKEMNDDELFTYYMTNFLLVRREFFLKGAQYGTAFWNKFREMKNLIKPGAFVFYLRAFMKMCGEGKILKIKNKNHLHYIISKYADNLEIQNCVTTPEKNFLVSAIMKLCGENVFNLTGEINLKYVLQKYQQNAEAEITNNFGGKIFFKLSKKVLMNHQVNLQKIYSRYLDYPSYFFNFKKYAKSYLKQNFSSRNGIWRRKVHFSLLKTRDFLFKPRPMKIIANLFTRSSFNMKNLNIYRNMTKPKIFNRMKDIGRYMNYFMIEIMRVFNDYMVNLKFNSFNDFKKVFMKVAENIKITQFIKQPKQFMSITGKMINDQKHNFSKKDQYKKIFSNIFEKFITFKVNGSQKHWLKFIQDGEMGTRSHLEQDKIFLKIKENYIKQKLSNNFMLAFLYSDKTLSVKNNGLMNHKIFARMKENLIQLKNLGLKAKYFEKFNLKANTVLKKIHSKRLKKVFSKIKDIYTDYRNGKLSIKYFENFKERNRLNVVLDKNRFKTFQKIKDSIVNLENRIPGIVTFSTKINPSTFMDINTYSNNELIFNKIRENLIKINNLSKGSIKFFNDILIHGKGKQDYNYSSILNRVKEYILTEDKLKSQNTIDENTYKNGMNNFNKFHRKVFGRIKENIIKMTNIRPISIKLFTDISAKNINFFHNNFENRIFSIVKENLYGLDQLKPGVIKLFTKMLEKENHKKSYQVLQKSFNRLYDIVLERKPDKIKALHFLKTNLNMEADLSYSPIEEHKKIIFNRAKENLVGLEKRLPNIIKVYSKNTKNLEFFRSEIEYKIFNNSKEILIRLERMKKGVIRLFTKLVKDKINLNKYSQYESILGRVREFIFQDRKGKNMARIFSHIKNEKFKKFNVFKHLKKVKIFNKAKENLIGIDRLKPGIIRLFGQNNVTYDFLKKKIQKKIFNKIRDSFASLERLKKGVIRLFINNLSKGGNREKKNYQKIFNKVKEFIFKDLKGKNIAKIYTNQINQIDGQKLFLFKSIEKLRIFNKIKDNLMKMKIKPEIIKIFTNENINYSMLHHKIGKKTFYKIKENLEQLGKLKKGVVKLFIKYLNERTISSQKNNYFKVFNRVKEFLFHQNASKNILISKLSYKKDSKHSFLVLKKRYKIFSRLRDDLYKNENFKPGIIKFITKLGQNNIKFYKRQVPYKTFLKVKENLLNLEGLKKGIVKLLNKDLTLNKHLSHKHLYKKIFISIRDYIFDDKTSKIKILQNFTYKTEKVNSMDLYYLQKKTFSRIKEKLFQIEKIKPNIIKAFLFLNKDNLGFLENKEDFKLFSRVHEYMFKLNKMKKGAARVFNNILNQSQFKLNGRADYNRVFGKIKEFIIHNRLSDKKKIKVIIHNTENTFRSYNKHLQSKIFEKIKENLLDLEKNKPGVIKLFTDMNGNNMDFFLKKKNFKIFSKLKDNLFDLEKMSGGIMKYFSKEIFNLESSKKEKIKKLFGRIKDALIKDNKKKDKFMAKYFKNIKLDRLKVNFSKRENNIFNRIKNNFISLEKNKPGIIRIITKGSNILNSNIKNISQSKYLNRIKDNLLAFEKIKPGSSIIFTKFLKKYKKIYNAQLNKVFNRIEEKIDFEKKNDKIIKHTEKTTKKGNLKLLSFLKNFRFFSKMKDYGTTIPNFIPEFIVQFQKSFLNYKFYNFNEFKTFFGRYSDIWRKYDLVKRKEIRFLFHNLISRRYFSNNRYNFDNILSKLNYKQNFGVKKNLQFLKENSKFFKISQKDISEFNKDLKKLKLKTKMVFDEKKIKLERSIMKAMETFDLTQSLLFQKKVKFALLKAIKLDTLIFSKYKIGQKKGNKEYKNDQLTEKLILKKIDNHKIEKSYINILDLKSYLKKTKRFANNDLNQKTILNLMTKREYKTLYFSKKLNLLNKKLRSKIFLDTILHVCKYKNSSKAQDDFLEFFKNIFSLKNNNFANNSDLIFLSKKLYKNYVKSKDDKLEFLKQIFKIGEKIKEFKSFTLKKILFKIFMKQKLKNLKFETDFTNSPISFLNQKGDGNLILKKSILKVSSKTKQVFLKYIREKFGDKFVKDKFGKYLNNQISLKKVILKYLEKNEEVRLEFLHYIKMYLNKNSIFYKGVNSLSAKYLFKTLENFDTEEKMLKLLKNLDPNFLNKKKLKKNNNNTVLKKTYLKSLIKKIYQKILGFYKNKSIVKKDLKNYYNNFKKIIFEVGDGGESNRVDGYSISLNFYNELIKHYMNNKRKNFINNFSKIHISEPTFDSNRVEKPGGNKIVCCSCACNTFNTSCCNKDNIDNLDMNFIKKTDKIINIDPVIKINYVLKDSKGKIQESDQISIDENFKTTFGIDKDFNENGKKVFTYKYPMTSDLKKQSYFKSGILNQDFDYSNKNYSIKNKNQIVKKNYIKRKKSLLGTNNDSIKNSLNKNKNFSDDKNFIKNIVNKLKEYQIKKKNVGEGKNESPNNKNLKKLYFSLHNVNPQLKDIYGKRLSFRF